MAAMPSAATSQLSVSPSDPRGPPPSSWKVVSSGAIVRPPRELERGATPDQQAAEGHDERGDAEIRDEVARAARRSAAPTAMPARTTTIQGNG